MSIYNPLAIRTQLVLYSTLTHSQHAAIRDYYKYSFYPRTITEWNKLPRDIALSNSLAAFRIMQFQTFIDTYYFALISAIISVTIVFLCLFVFFS